MLKKDSETNKVEGRENITAGRDIYIGRTKSFIEKLPELNEIFDEVDQLFEMQIGSKTIFRWGKNEFFSSERLFGSLVTIGLPASVAFEIPQMIIPLIANRLEFEEPRPVEAADIKRAVLEVITGLQFLHPYASEDEVTTWCSAYVRRYGSPNEHINILDGSMLKPLNMDFLVDQFIPHLLEKNLGMSRGFDVLGIYKHVFSSRVVQRMAREILKIANSLNLYEVEYRTLFRLVSEIMIKPPHPWIVNTNTMEAVADYNLEKSREHLYEISGKSGKKQPKHLVPSALECAAHASAAILSKHGFMLGVESKYGLDELMRWCDIRNAQKNLVLWEFCTLNKFEERLPEFGFSIQTFNRFLLQLKLGLLANNNSDQDLITLFEYCSKLDDLARKVCE